MAGFKDVLCAKASHFNITCTSLTLKNQVLHAMLPRQLDRILASDLILLLKKALFSLNQYSCQSKHHKALNFKQTEVVLDS